MTADKTTHRQAKEARAAGAIEAKAEQDSRGTENACQSSPEPTVLVSLEEKIQRGFRASQQNPSLVDVLETVKSAAQELANVAFCYAGPGEDLVAGAMLHGARVLEGVATAVMDPQRFKALAQAASDLSIRRGEHPHVTGAGYIAIGSGHHVGDNERLPISLKERAPAAAALKEAVQYLLKKRPRATARELAERVASARCCIKHLGANRLTPRGGTWQDQAELFTKAIERLFERKDRRKDAELEAEDIVTACARACGTTGEIFGAARKRVKR